jgi:hypothetical protein
MSVRATFFTPLEVGEKANFGGGFFVSLDYGSQETDGVFGVKAFLYVFHHFSEGKFMSESEGHWGISSFSDTRNIVYELGFVKKRKR